MELTTIERLSCLPIAIRLWVEGMDKFPRSRLSSALGVGHSAAQPGHFCMDGQSWFAVAVAVANNPDPLPAVRGRDGASRNNKCPAGVADAFQVSDTAVECHADEPSNVLSNDPSGPDCLDNSKHFRPEVTVICDAALRTCVAEWLTGESSADELGSIICGAIGSDVVMHGHSGKILLKDAAAEWVDLDELDGAEPARHL